MFWGIVWRCWRRWLGREDAEGVRSTKMGPMIIYYLTNISFTCVDSVTWVCDCWQWHCPWLNHRWNRVWTFDPRPDPTRTLLTRWPVPVTECLCFELRDYFDDGVLLVNAFCQKSLVHAAHNDVKIQSTQNPTDSTVSYFSHKSDNKARAKATKSC